MRRLLVLALLLFPAQAQAITCVQDRPDATVQDVGDSHTYFSGCASYPGWDVNANGGRGSYEAYWTLVAVLTPQHETIVYDIGTNDYWAPEFYRNQLSTLWDLADGRSIVLVTVWLPADGANRGKPVNDAMRDFADNHPQKVTVVDWAGYARSHGFPTIDGIHFTTSQYAQRVELIRDAT